MLRVSKYGLPVNAIHQARYIQLSRMKRYESWEAKQVYMECTECGFAKTYPVTQVSKNDTRDCEACGAEESFGPGRYWIRPPGFAHPIDVEEVTSPR